MTGSPGTRAPYLSEHTESRLRKLGFAAEAIARLRENGAI
jgi:crotonobetainyl-CoA:carnitine CoA-transferase CaiB-like acyl-CoA transferase